jgi:hypothetical protein
VSNRDAKQHGLVLARQHSDAIPMTRSKGACRERSPLSGGASGSPCAVVSLHRRNRPLPHSEVHWGVRSSRTVIVMELERNPVIDRSLGSVSQRQAKRAREG